VLKDLPPIPDFRDEGNPTLALMQLLREVTAEEGKGLAVQATKLERDRSLVAEVKESNQAANGGLATCECCGFTDAEASYLDPLPVPNLKECRKARLPAPTARAR
jgi:hypothetical protein